MNEIKSKNITVKKDETRINKIIAGIKQKNNTLWFKLVFNEYE